MKYAADFRSIARNALQGKWGIAVVVGLIAVLLGGVVQEGPEVRLNIDLSEANVSFEYAGQTIISTGGLSPEAEALVVGSSVYFALAAIAMAFFCIFLGSIIKVGYARFNLELVDYNEPSFNTLFSYFTYWKTAVAARLLQSICVLLWSLLFIIPGIIAAYSYSMTEYILADNPEMAASEAIERSKEMMSGNRWRLFCLQFSFIGWSILCSFTMGIGNLWLTPYKQAATAAFYREVSGTEHVEIPG